MGPLRDVNQPEPPVAGNAPVSCYGPSSAFLPPSTVCSPTGLAGLFRPAAAYRVPSPQGFVPLRGAVPGRPRPMPSGRCRLRLCGFPRQDACRRLQGLAPRSESGGFGRRLGVRCSVPLSGLSSSGCSLPAPRQLSPPPPTVLHATNPLRATLGVLLARGSVGLGSGYRPARGFRQATVWQFCFLARRCSRS
jgi:hypothetical protein